ncbi:MULTISPECIES: hypothetical protein [Campylobacter]|uniref:hypothetical protein n=1 Tax=Campylobacter TaxID=194 RepID=UPI0015D7A517|nr:hypothetical protein [Campylobacter sp. P0024]MCR8678815.1 hypothetical protein [Campylobacter sp. RM19072]
MINFKIFIPSEAIKKGVVGLYNDNVWSPNNKTLLKSLKKFSFDENPTIGLKPC